MKKILIFAFLISLIVPLGHCQEQLTVVGFDGTQWNRSLLIKDTDTPPMRKSKEVIRKYFLRGIYEGYLIGLTTADPDNKQFEKYWNYYYHKGRYKDIALAVDHFYSDPKNLKIPVTEALLVIKMDITNPRSTSPRKVLKQFRR
ncbi:MAG: hypothetical protein P9L88_06080 [Candidatus Tantalella remota]|nr:hypothetical protein [Candidatus Tantalella remota]